MAVRPGEENVATLFGDIHYFYGPETVDPPHHRFNKGSYVYLFENANERRARIEIANLVGTDNQDAFDGSLDKVHVTYSYRHHCMVSLSVGDVEGHDEWHLPTYDPRNENKYHYKLHSLDIYFWTQDDALAFVNGVRRVLPPNQVDVQDEPAPPQQQQQQQHPEVSSVVQRLENVAISDSALPPPPPPPPQTNSASNGGIPSFAPRPSQPSPQAQTTTAQIQQPLPPASLPFPTILLPPPPPSRSVTTATSTRSTSVSPRTPARLFPPGLVSGMPAHGLGPLSPGVPPPQFTHPPGAPSFPGPPVGTPGFAPQGFGGHHAQHPGMQRAATMPVTAAGMPSPALQSPYGAQQPPFPQSPAPPYTTHHQITPPIASPGLASPPPPPPMGGFSGYNCTTQPASGHAAGNEYAIHQQAYRPAEGEVVGKYGPKKEVRGRLEENAGRVERGVTGMLKKFERKFG
ncbi:hypothetical protein N0V93_001749 [Gnomoniopsis smithogilvyi]|uniref:RNA recognition motif-containing protein n=1 Tax=Gnomoniopsis smithogilvyi TaxID=1191159 RepID=A0A9W9D1Y8_9PEZI|nr:hypothetical protein N0V93_001749 [Gnomoniopsis smithogilvyi]